MKMKTTRIWVDLATDAQKIEVAVSIDVFVSVQFSSPEWSTFWKLKPRMIKFGTKKM